MEICAFSMQIGNYKVYATIPRNELSKNDQDLRKIHTEATIVFYEYCPGSSNLCSIVDLMIWNPLFRAVFVFRVCESFSLLLRSKHPLSEIYTYFWSNWRFLQHDFREICFFFCQSVVWKLDCCLKRDFCHQYSPSANCCSFYLIGH